MKSTITLRSLLRSPIDDIERHWNDNVRAGLAAVMVAIEMLVYSIWYVICFCFDLIDDNKPDAVNQTLAQDVSSHTVVIPMLGLTLAVLAYSSVMFFVFLRSKPKTRQWVWLQAGFVLVYFAYSTVFTQIFGENTIITGLNLSGGVILGLFLLERNLVLMAFLLSICSVILISLNRKLHLINLGAYADSSAQDYWFWIITYLCFAVCKVIATVVVVDWMLRILANQQAKIYELSQRDTLTSIDNRRTIYCYLDYIWQYRKAHRCVSLIYFDLDKFKDINDLYGHATGDKTLVEMCHVVNAYLAEHLNSSYRFGRLGGEEFVIVLPNYDGGQALHLAEALRQTIKSHAITSHDNQQTFFVTASFGVSTLLQSAIMTPANVQLADSGSYGFSSYLKHHLQVSPNLPLVMQDLINMGSNATRNAKQLGRDRVVDGGFTIL